MYVAFVYCIIATRFKNSSFFTVPRYSILIQIFSELIIPCPDSLVLRNCTGNPLILNTMVLKNYTINNYEEPFYSM